MERIRRRSLSPERLAEEDAAKKADEEKIRENLKDVTAKEIFAMTLAALSIVVPYLGAFALFLFLFWLVIKLMAG